MAIYSSTIQDLVSNIMPQPYYRFEGANDYINTGDGWSPGTGDFSFSAWVYMPPSIEDTYGAFVTKGRIIPGDDVNGATLYHHGSNIIAFDYKAGGTWTRHILAADATIYYDKWIHAAVSLDRDGNIVGSVNGIITTTTASTHRNNTSAIESTELYIGAMRNTADSGINTNMTLDGSISGVRIYNYALSATEMQELYSGASVPWKYRETKTVFTSDYSANNGSWTAYSNNVLGNSSNIVSIAYVDHINGGYHYLTSGAGAEQIKGKRYRLTITAHVNQGAITVGFNNAGAYSSPLSFTETSATTKSFEWTARATNGDTYIYGADSYGTNEIFYITDLKLEQIGVVAEYDGSSAMSSTWYDKSGNDFSGTVSGATLENRLSTLEVISHNPIIRLADTQNSNYAQIVSDAGNLSLAADVGNGQAWSTMTFQMDGSTKMALTATGRLGIGTEDPNGPLHLHSATAGSVTAHAGSDELVLENSAEVGMEMLCPDAYGGSIRFQSPTSTSIGQIAYYHNSHGASDQMRFATKDSDQMVIDSEGNVGIGTMSPTSILNIVEDGQPQVNIDSHSSDSNQAYLNFQKTGGTEASPTNVTWYSNLGQIQWKGWNTGGGGGHDIAAHINCSVDANSVDGACPGKLTFATANTGGTVVNALILDKSQNAHFPGDVGIGVNGGYAYGDAVLHLSTDGTAKESTQVLMASEHITVQDDATHVINIPGTGSLFFIQQDAVSSGYASALFYGNYASAPTVGNTTLLSDESGVFSNTKDTDSKTNVYIDGYNNDIVIQNKVGGVKKYTVQVIAVTGQ